MSPLLPSLLFFLALHSLSSALAETEFYGSYSKAFGRETIDLRRKPIDLSVTKYEELKKKETKTRKLMKPEKQELIDKKLISIPLDVGYQIKKLR